MQFLTRVPLWTTMNSLLSSERWGWELTSLGTPWVAQRVWEIPQWVSWTRSKSSSSSTIVRERVYFKNSRRREREREREKRESKYKMLFHESNANYNNRQCQNLLEAISSSRALTLPRFLIKFIPVESGVSTPIPGIKIKFNLERRNESLFVFFLVLKERERFKVQWG